MTNRSVVINREFGSGGREIGKLVAERSGMEFYDTRILQEAATRRGLPQDLLEQFDERLQASTFFDLSFFTGVESQTATLPYRMHQAISDVIVAAAQRAPAVFIGRCADTILEGADLPLRSVFVYGTDLDRKIARAIEVDGVDPKYAEGYIAKMDKTRRRYQEFFTDTTFGDRRNYDLCLNSARLDYEQCAGLILASLDETAGA
ncbi:AAA family ATPase [Propionicicella superfundia]|uniref:cytidylate kinase-like family protein n=1 Tax=Propionicicella superfundia TaxID=348582 RepID=UPI0004102079|nr:cytidylate kinase-like family protein [Propionicicella superfundia]